MTKLLTVVIPSYNVEQYYEETLPTMLTVPSAEKIEMLIVNDGSKDDTLEEAKKFEKAYPTIVKVIDKENGGHGSTINVGIKEATGKYFKVVDADDWVDSSNFEELLNYLESVDADMVVSPYHKIYMDTGVEELDSFENVTSGTKYLIDDFLRKIDAIPWMHAVIYRTNLLKENNIKLDEHMFYVDIEYITFPLAYISTVAYFGKSIYQYRLGNPTQSVSMASYKKNSNMHKHIIEQVVKYCLNHDDLSDTKKYYLEKLINHLVATQMKIYLSDDDWKKGKKDALEFDAYLRAKGEQFISLKHSAKLMKSLILSHYLAFPFVSYYVKRKFN